MRDPKSENESAGLEALSRYDTSDTPPEGERGDLTRLAAKYQMALLQLVKTDNSDLGLALKRMTETDSKTLGVGRVSVWLFSEDRSEIVCKNLYNLSKNLHESGLRLKAEDYPCYFQAMEESRTIAADDACADPRTREFAEGYLKPYGITSMMDVPVWLHGKVVGVVCHEHTGQMREWTVEEQDFAASIADMVSLALEAEERRRAEESLQKAHDELEMRVIERTAELSKSNELLKHEIAERKRVEDDLRIVNSITQAMNESFELKEVYRITLDKILEQEYVDIADIYLVDEARNEAVLQDHRNLPDDYIRRAERIPYPKGVTWKVINTGEILNVRNAQEDPDMGPAGRELGFRSMLGVPIAREGKTLGVLWLLSYREHRFTKSLEDLLTSIGRQIAIAVARANLYGELSKKNRYEAVISAVTQGVHRSINLQEVVENAVQAMGENIDSAKHIAIYLVEGEEAVMKAYKGHPDWFIERVKRIPYPKDFTWKTIIDGKPRYCPDVDEDTVIGPAGREVGTKSYLSMPIRYEGSTVGTINIHSFEKYAFDENEIKLLEAVARQIEIAINNAKQAEALRQSEERYRTLFDQSPVGAYIFDMGFRIVQCNESFVQIFQSSYDKIIGLNLLEVNDQSFTPAMKRAIEGETVHQEGFYEATTSSAKMWLSVRFSPLLDPNGSVIAGMAVVEDITQQKKMEEDILRVQKLESLGVLAGGIAHDFNNLLTAILGNISLLKVRAGPEDKSYKRLDEAEKASLRAKDLTAQLLTFAKGGAPVKKVTSIGKMITESAGFALRGSNVRCESHITGDLWPAEVDEGQISQVIHNLILNAQQAMPGGGVIKLVADNIALNEGNSLNLKAGRYVEITIEDRGIGILKEHLARVFDPYFTTKQKGSGLGLSMVHSIIKNHDGYIGVESEIGRGTKFCIYLPACDERASELAGAVRESALRGGGRVLVMDDEELVRMVLSEMLSQIGYEVEFANDGAEAIDLYERAKERGTPFDVLIMDLTVPGGMGGREAIKKLLEMDSAVNAIVSSGYSSDPVMSNYREYGFRGVVTKPYRIEELSRVMYEVRGDSEIH